MNVEDLLRSELHSEASTTAPIDNLLEVSTRRGRRKQLHRRLAVAGSSTAAAAIVVAGSLVIANAGNPTSTVKVNAANSPSSASTPEVTPWWQTWTEGRHYGPIDQTFLTNARPTYDTAQGPEPTTFWASGTEPDGTDWAMYTDAHDGHIVQYVQGWNGRPDFGESPQVEQPGLTYEVFFSPTLQSHDDYHSSSQFMIIVGKPGTTSIKYAADGHTYSDLTVQDGIAVVQLPNFPPANAQVQLATADGVYATDSPEAARAGGATSSPDPGAGTATPSATPGSGTAKAPQVQRTAPRK